MSKIGRRKLPKSVVLTTLIWTNLITEEVVFYVPEEFGGKGRKMSVKLAHFLNITFDFIIGLNILCPFGAIIDFNSIKLVIHNNRINLFNYQINIYFEDIHYLAKSEIDELDTLITEITEFKKQENYLLKRFLYNNKKTFYIEG